MLGHWDDGVEISPDMRAQADSWEKTVNVSRFRRFSFLFLFFSLSFSLSLSLSLFFFFFFFFIFFIKNKLIKKNKGYF